MSVASEEKGGKEGKRQPVDQARATGQLGERVRKMLGNVLTIISCRFLTSRGRFQEANITLCSGKRVPIALRKGWREKKRSIDVGVSVRSTACAMEVGLDRRPTYLDSPLSDQIALVHYDYALGNQRGVAFQRRAEGAA